MIETEQYPLQCGGDPRTLSSFASLRDELSKLTHPARPDINWPYAESLCLTLFKQNGAELQTLAWYTLSRAHQVGLPGINQGLVRLEALITRHWDHLWPQSAHARAEILTTLSRRLQQYLRSLAPAGDDPVTLRQAEDHLRKILRTLQHTELKYQSGLEALEKHLQNAAIRLENTTTRSEDMSIQPVVLHVPTVAPRDDLISVQQESAFVPPHPDAETISWRWKPFIAGMLTMLVLVIPLQWGYTQLTQAQQSLMATISPLPARLAWSIEETLQAQAPTDGKKWLSGAEQQLTTLSGLSPVWFLHYGDQLVRLAQSLWPENPQTLALTQRWQQQLAANRLSSETLSGWKQGMTRLNQLTVQLNRLDIQKGKYLTVSELKSQVFAITHAFNQTLPVEEELRQLAELNSDTEEATALRAQTERHLKQLLTGYRRLTPAEHSPQP